MDSNIKIDYYDFRYVITNTGYRLPLIHFGSDLQNEIFGYYSYTINHIERLQNLISRIEAICNNGETERLPGGEEAYIIAKNDYLEFVITLPGYEEPYFVETQKFLDILKEYKNWILKIENCQISGLIPQSKLDSWTCIPNDYIKEEYWERKEE